MASRKPPANPFYILLLLVGVAFLITATAYGVVTLRTLRGVAEAGSHPLEKIIDRHGTLLLLGEVALLALFTFGAIGTDDYWTRRAARSGREAAEELET